MRFIFLGSAGALCKILPWRLVGKKRHLLGGREEVVSSIWEL